MPRPPVIFLMGPTASGKSGLALALAARFPLEIVNADSVQVYRGMNIGTAKPSQAEQLQVRHHLLDLVEPDDPFSAGRYREAALATITDIHNRGQVPLLVGGTGLYFRVVEQGVAPTPPVPDEFRQQVMEAAHQLGWPALHQQLAHVDPQWAQGVTLHDGQRIMRGLSVFMATGKPLTAWQQEGHHPLPFPLLKLIVNRPRPLLYQRIEQRFHLMMEQGLLSEVEVLLNKGYSLELPAMKAVGYRQLFRHFLAAEPLNQSVNLAVQESRRYAKRQLTWLRPEPHALWVDGDIPHQAIGPVARFLAEFGFSSSTESV